MFYCPSHQCMDCGKKAAAAGGLIFRCTMCPNAFCEDHCPHDAAIRGECERFQNLGQRHPKQACFIECSGKCIDDAAEEKAGTLWSDGGNGQQDRSDTQLEELLEMWVEKKQDGVGYKNVREYVAPPVKKEKRGQAAAAAAAAAAAKARSGKAPALTPSARAAKAGNRFYGSGGAFKAKLGYFPTAHLAACAVGLYDYAKSKLGLELHVPISPSTLGLCLTFTKQDAPSRLKPYTVAARQEAAQRHAEEVARMREASRKAMLSSWGQLAAVTTGVAQAAVQPDVPAAASNWSLQGESSLQPQEEAPTGPTPMAE
jgi:hypothetical protein